MNAFTFGDQAFLARAGTDHNSLYPLGIPNLIKWYRADSMLPYAADGNFIGGPTQVGNKPPWRDDSGYGVSSSGATTGSTGGGNSNIINTSGGSFVFAATDVGRTIRWTSGVAIDSWIVAYGSPTQVQLNKTQIVAADTFSLHDDAYNTSLGGLFKTNIVGTMPVVRFDATFGGNNYLWFRRLSLNDFTLVAVSMCNDVGATTGSFLISDATVFHNIRRRYKTIYPDILLFQGGGGTQPRSNPEDVAGTVTDLNVASFRRTSSSGVVQLRLNQSNLVTQGGTDAVAFRADLLGAGVADWNNHTDMGEFLLWDRVLSDTELSDLYIKYLKPRWTTLP